jgi:hypothetical protein
VLGVQCLYDRRADLPGPDHDDLHRVCRLAPAAAVCGRPWA